MLALITGQAVAEDGDFRTGTFNGTFCGSPARFDIKTKKSGKWIFEGLILIKHTNEYDRITIEQLSDQSLRIKRFLTGQNKGKSQRVTTEPPKMFADRMTFFKFGGSGVGCNNGGEVTKIDVFY